MAEESKTGNLIDRLAARIAARTNAKKKSNFGHSAQTASGPKQSRSHSNRSRGLRLWSKEGWDNGSGR